MARIYVKPRNSRSVRPRTLDYNVIEQIANGIEKMVVQWNHTKESRIIRPYTSGSSTAPSQHSDESVQAGPPEEPPANGPTEMSIFMRSSGTVNIPELSWYVKPPTDGVPEPYDPVASENARVATREEGSVVGITPRLESALERIEEMNSANPDTSNRVTMELTELTRSVRKDLQAADAVQGNAGVLHQDRDQQYMDTVNYESAASDRTDEDLPRVSRNRVDDWTETAEIVGNNNNVLPGAENIRELISFSKKREPIKEKEELLDDYKVKIEELQIALLECSTEYEVKIVEMKMMMLNMKSHYRQQMTGSGNVNVFEPQSKEFSIVTSSQAKQNVDFLKKQMQKLKLDKENLSKELFTLKKKQRQSEKQKKSLDDALNKVSSLRRELAKRDEEILDSHLREKEQKAQLNELHHALQSARATQAEPGKLLALLPLLRNWLKSVKKGQYHQEVPQLVSSMENLAFHSQALMRKPPVKMPLTTALDYSKENRQNPRVDRIVGSVTKEIQALQKALEKLACGRTGGASSAKEFEKMLRGYA